MKTNDLINLVGKTPLVRLSNINPNPKVRLLGKLEGNNPGGSVKDRPAFFMIDQALKKGSLKGDFKLIEPTSGNTGIALAMIASLKQIAIELVMPENASKERVKTMQAYGAKVTLTSEKKSMEGTIDYAREKVAKGGYVMLDQFSNPDNKLAHYKTTGPEVWNDTNHQVTHFVSSMGTTGTITGVSTYLKEKNKNIEIIGVQPKEGSCIPGIRRWKKEYLPKIYEPNRVDEIMDVSTQQATEMTRRLAKEEGIFSGMSSGGATFVAVQIAKRIKTGVIVVIICDRGDRYLSTHLF